MPDETESKPAHATWQNTECSSPSPCDCECNSEISRLVYAIGQLAWDFGTEARRDSIMQHMKPPSNPYDARQFLSYLQDNPWDVASVFWTLNLDGMPIYAVQPHGSFGREIGERLRQFLEQQLDEGVERISIPGRIVGAARLFTGQTVPVVYPSIRGMYSWSTRALVQSACGGPPNASATPEENEPYDKKTQAVRDFLTRVYDELRYLGKTPPERAINYSATNALLEARIFEDAIKEDMRLDTITAERSPICRPGSDCWDVKLTFFDPQRLLERAKKTYRVTVDVEDDVPVMVGVIRHWFVR